VVVERLVFFCRTAKKPDLGGIEEAPREDETGAAVRGERFGGQRSTCHIRMRVDQWLEPVKTAVLSAEVLSNKELGSWRPASECTPAQPEAVLLDRVPYAKIA
jgi:hypothetical protein